MAEARASRLKPRAGRARRPDGRLTGRRVLRRSVQLHRAPVGPVAAEAPLAQAGSPFGRLWNPLDIAVSAVVDTARDGRLTVRHGDPDDP